MLSLLSRITVSDAWSKATKLPLGNRVFSKLIGRMAPYTGTVGATVLDLRDGYCRVELRDRPGVRNHLRSIHAVALMNLGEMATGLAVMHAIDGRGRGIVTSLKMEYFKKARGTITATCDTPLPSTPGRHEHEVTGELRDGSGDLVARAYATWKLELE
jgi:acyl-coenzyme A thioesterase PaaI-like protein